MADFRTERLGRQIRQMIGELILEGRIKDRRVSPFVSITRVEVSGDLSYAEVYVSDIREGTKIGEGTEGLRNAAGFIRSLLGSSLHLRKIPVLRFHADTSIREGFDMVAKIGELAEEARSRPEAETPPPEDSSQDSPAMPE